MLLAGALFIFSTAGDSQKLRSLFLQLITLGSFHWFSQLNWCHPLYFLVVTNASIYMPGLIRSTLYASLCTIVYSFIRLSYSPPSLYNYLVTGSDFFSLLLIVIVVHYVYNAKREKEMLNKEKHHLTTHDTLTGLLNFEEFHNRLESMLTQNSKLLLIIIDCTDLKSMNDEHGFQSGNRVLKNVAELLKKIFIDAQLIARFGGDEFAIAMKIDEDDTFYSMTKLIDDEMIKLLGIQVTYGYALYPDDGLSKNSLISIAENSLFSMKREIWLKREENMFRSEKLRMVGELAAGMAHEIRNPLTTVKGFLQISKSNEYNIHPWYDLIMDEITRMSELTAEFLQFSKPHATNIREQTIQECIQRVIHLMGPRAILLGHQLYFEDCVKPIYVMMDKDKIVQVLLNLVQNALEAMDISGVVYITLAEQNNHAVIEILDTGTGIPDSKLEEIFTPFYTTKETGIGLGLSICQKAIQDHGGGIEVSSTSDLGTTFRITLPLVKIPAASLT